MVAWQPQARRAWGKALEHAQPHTAQVYLLGLYGALSHMAEILPLVSLLVGLVTLPSLPGSILISVSEPVTCAPTAHACPATCVDSQNETEHGLNDRQKPVVMRLFYYWHAGACHVTCVRCGKGHVEVQLVRCVMRGVLCKYTTGCIRSCLTA